VSDSDIYIYIYIYYISIYSSIYPSIHIYIYIYIHIHTWIYIYIDLRTIQDFDVVGLLWHSERLGYIYIYIYYISIYSSIYPSIHIYIYFYIHIHTWIYIYRFTHHPRFRRRRPPWHSERLGRFCRFGRRILVKEYIYIRMYVSMYACGLTRMHVCIYTSISLSGQP